MRPLRIALPLLLAAGSALAQNRPPSPCERYIPTGEKLPRQDYSRTQMLLLPFPNPVYRDQPVAKAWPDEPVTILQECGLKLRVRTQRGEEGWVPTAMLNNENRLYELARRRPPATEAECSARLLDPRMVEDCRRGLSAKREIDAEVKSAVYLSAREMPAYLSGKTLVLRPRVDGTPDDPAYPMTAYFAPDGEAFVKAGTGSNRLRWRGRWVLGGDTVCLPSDDTICARVRKLADGRAVWVPNGYPAGYSIEHRDGDTAGTVAVVSEVYPNPVLPPAPKGAEGVSMPTMGR